MKKNSLQVNKPSSRHFEEEKTDYDNLILWKKSFPGHHCMEWIRESFRKFDELDEQKERNLFFFKNQSTYAFRINVDFLELNPRLLWNYWKDQIKEAGYVLKNSEVVDKKDQSTLRYYLKPKLKYKVEGDQRYGNISLELIKRNEILSFIILKCSWYQDQHFNEPLPFTELLDQLTN